MNDTARFPSLDLEQRFLELVRVNEARLRRICRVYGRAAGAEDDLYQEILVQLWRALPSFEGRSSADTWLYRVALNTALTWSRRHAVRSESSRRHGSPDTHDDGALLEREPAPDPQPDERLEAKERLERLYAAIERLDDADRALVVLYLDERSYTEMAEVLGITESHVGVKLHRIRKQMASWLVKEET